MQVERRRNKVLLASGIIAVALIVIVFPLHQVFALQFGRPDSTISAGGWTAANAPTLHEATDEATPNGDTDYASKVGSTGTAELGLSDVTDPGASTGHKMRFTCSAPNGSGSGAGKTEKMKMELFQGAALIVSSGEQICPRGVGVYSTFETPLTVAQANLITDYTDLRLKITVTQIEAVEEIRVTQVEFEVPDPGAAPPSQTVSQTESPVTASEIVDVGGPGLKVIKVIKAGSGNIVNAVREVSTFINTGAQNDAAVTLAALKSTETRSGSLPSASFQCVPGKILKIVTDQTLQNFNIQIYFDVNDISNFEEDTLQLFFYENQAGQNVWIELPIDQKDVDGFGTFVKAKAPRTLDPTKLSAEFFCIGGVIK